MAEVKFTKSELRNQQNRLLQLQKYLPTLQLKKAMLQVEVNEARNQIIQFQADYKALSAHFETFAELLSEVEFDPKDAMQIKDIKKRFENIAGVEVPVLDSVSFVDFSYSLFETPPWVDAVIFTLRKLVESKVRIEIAKEKKAALEKELREVSIRVNLFEKILIPRSLKNIKRIKVFLGDLQLAAVSQAKVAKTKIEERKSAELLHAH